MSYIEKSLSRGERLLYLARYSWVYTIWGWIALLGGLTLGVALLVVFGFTPPRWAAIFIAVLIALGALVFFWIMIPYWTTEMGVTDFRFVIKRGWLSRSTFEMRYSAIEEVNVDQSVLGRLFNYGTVKVRGTGVDDVEVSQIAAPVKLRRALDDAANAAMPHSVASAQAHSTR